VKDRLSFYRFQKKPTHSRGYHFIPSNLLNVEKSTVDGKERLSRLSETAFQELCADVYDEVNCGFKGTILSAFCFDDLWFLAQPAIKKI